MKKPLACLLSLLCLACNSQATNNYREIFNNFPSNNVLLTEGFENGNLNNWVRHSIDGNGSINIVNQPVLNGNHAVRFSVPNDGQSYRSELATDSTNWGTYHYQFSIFLPNNWQQSNFGTILAQWHGSKLADGNNTNPPISLAVQDGHWRFLIHQLDSATTVSEKKFDLPKIKPGVWNHFDIRITWSTPTTPGSVMLYHDNQLWVNYSGINNYHQRKPPYFKIGIYQPQWNPSKGVNYAIGGKPLVVYDDDIKVNRE